ncbi:MAG: hypothetical protein K2H22_02095, partial [Muribaculaceae bacterium]|nr:hypothetical protein [Muribaculaceae bacterium]
AVSDHPDNPTFLDPLEWILYLKGQYAEALKVQEKAMENITPEAEATGEYWDHFGDIQYMNGQKDKALESWKKALEVDGDNKEIAEKVRNKRLKSKD